jgi:hypothetical protein
MTAVAKPATLKGTISTNHMKISKQLRTNVNHYKARILEAHAAGFTAHETAKIIGISNASIYRYSWVMGIKWKYQNPENHIPDKITGEPPHVMPGPMEAEKIAMWRDNGETWPSIHRRISPKSRFEPWYAMLYTNRKTLFTPSQLVRAFKRSIHHYPKPQPETREVKHGWFRRFLIWLDS